MNDLLVTRIAHRQFARQEIAPVGARAAAVRKPFEQFRILGCSSLENAFTRRFGSGLWRAANKGPPVYRAAFQEGAAR